MKNIYLIFLLMFLFSSSVCISQSENFNNNPDYENLHHHNYNENQEEFFNSPEAKYYPSSISDFRANDQVGNSSKNSLEISMNENGISIFVWTDYRQGTGNVYAQIMDVSGDLIGKNIKINESIDVNSHINPDVAVNDDNEFLVVWYDYRSGSHIYGQFISEEGEFLGNNFQISDELSRGNLYPAIAGNGNQFVISWSDRRGGSYYDIYAQRLNKQGEKIGENFVVNTDSQTVSKYHSDVELRNDGSVYIAWHSTVEGQTEIYSIMLDSLNNPFSDQIKLTEPGEGVYNGYPSVGKNNKGFLIVWHRRYEQDYNIAGQFIGGSGNKSGNNFVINNDLNSSQLYPSVSSDTTGRMIVNWYDYRNGFVQIYGQEFMDSSSVGTNYAVSEAEYNGTKNFIAVGVNNNGNFVSGWVDYQESSKYKIMGRKFSPQGEAVIPTVRVDDDENSSNQLSPSVEIFEDGSNIILWSDYRNRSSQISFQKYDVDGNPIGENIQVSQSGTQYDPGIVKLQNRNFIIFWREYTRSTYNQYEVVAQKYFNTGETIGDKFVVSKDPIQGTIYNIDGASNSAGEFVITWQRRVGSYNRIYLQKYDKNGLQIGPNALVTSDTTTNHYSPRVGIDSLGNFAVTYYSYNGGYDIKLRHYNSDAIAVGEEIIVNDNIKNSSQSLPDISVNSKGECVVVWRDLRGPSGMFFQRYGKIGSETEFVKIDSNKAVTDYNVGFTSPVVSMNNNGQFVISWYEKNENFNDLKLKVFDNQNNPISDVFYISETIERNQIKQNINFVGQKIYNVWQSNHEPNVGYDIWGNVMELGDLVTSVNSSNEGIPAKMELSQNYPNPFNPTTKIKYSIPNSASDFGQRKVTLKVYDILGREVVTLVNQNQKAGSYEIQFNAVNLPSGVYLYQLTAGEHVSVKKMTLLK